MIIGIFEQKNYANNFLSAKQCYKGEITKSATLSTNYIFCPVIWSFYYELSLQIFDI